MDPEQHKRLEYRIPANLTIDHLGQCQDEPETIQATIRELSASGCRLQSSLDLELGQEFEISFSLIDNYRINCARVRVVRRLSQRSHKVVALVFLSLTEEEQQQIREFVVWKESQEE